MNENIVIHDRQEELAHAFLREFLKREGHTFETIGQLPPEQLRQLMVRASVYTSSKLAEIDDRAEMIAGIHHATESLG